MLVFARLTRKLDKNASQIRVDQVRALHELRNGGCTIEYLDGSHLDVEQSMDRVLTIMGEAVAYSQTPPPKRC
jgi:surfactin synthase thioesterase subunit